MKIRDRIRELRRVPASQLQPNPRNWRTHPTSQQDSLKAVLAEVGYADALLARETPEGGLMLIDGHLRAETTPDQLVPVLILDVDEAEADKLLVSLDPLAAMAGADDEKLAGLLRTVKTGSAALQDMLTRLAADAQAASESNPPAESSPIPETRYAIVVNCESERQQLELLEQFETAGLDCRALVV
jgi:hypothetical protein